MTRADDLVRAIAGRSSDGSALRPSLEKAIAVDEDSEFAALFVVEVDGLTLYSRIDAFARENGVWEEIGSSGSRRDLPYVPWSPSSTDTTNGVLVTDVATFDVETAAGEVRSLSAVAGFAGPNVSQIEIRSSRGVERRHVLPPISPFVVIALGSERVAIVAVAGGASAADLTD